MKKLGFLLLCVALLVGTIYLFTPNDANAEEYICSYVMLEDCKEMGGTLGMTHCDYSKCRWAGTHNQLCTYCTVPI